MKRFTMMMGLASITANIAMAECPDSAIDLATDRLVVDSDLAANNDAQNPRSYCMRQNQTYYIGGGVFVKAHTVLYIEPGVTVKGATRDDFLVISQDAKILAQGTAANPIVMKPTDRSQYNPGDWGGLAINGRAPTNKCFENDAYNPRCTIQGEGSTGPYGGDKPDDDSGVLSYVRLEYAGGLYTDEDERNGIAFQGVGYNTKVEHVQIHRAADDGIEFFGGTVNVRHLVITGAEDDSIDWTDGYTGHIQFAMVQQNRGVGDNGVEADGNGTNLDAQPFSDPVLANITIIGGGSELGTNGLKLRKNTKAKLFNLEVSQFATCVKVEVPEANLVREGFVTRSCGTDGELTQEYSNAMFDYETDDFLFDEVDYVGAGSDWFCGWTRDVSGC